MNTRRRCLTGPLALVLVLLTASLGLADSWLTVAPDGSVRLEQNAEPVAPEIMTAEFDRGTFQVAVSVEGFELEPVKSPAGDFIELSLPGEWYAGEVGAPALPVIRRLFATPDGARVDLALELGSSVTVDSARLGLPAQLAPVQPPIEKIPGAKESAPFVVDPAAYGAVRYGTARATATELGIVRGQRLWLLEVWPVAHNPAAEQLTFWRDIVVDVEITGGVESDLTPMPGTKSIVLNPGAIPSLAPRGTGNYLIVVADIFQSAIQPFANAKSAQGFNVTTHVVPAGTSNAAIKSFIQGLWGGANSPDYILLVGDTNTIPHWIGSGTGSPDTDLQYACMDGGSDWYPDIAIGRFPARTTTQLQAMVDKTLYWENGPLADPDYVKRAVFMASSDNYTVSEGTHNWVISNYMTPNDIVSDKLYCHTYNATTQQVRNSFNDGRFFGIFSGHGATTYWADGPHFDQADVNGLLNQNMYAFVMSYACVTGSYTLNECFTETWIRAPQKGACAIYGSSVNSYWTEDDVLEKRHFDSIYDDNDSVVAEAGPVWVDTLMRYVAQMGNGSMTRRYFEMYNLMGDPSLPFPGNCSDAGTAQMDSTLYACEDTITIRVVDCGLDVDPNVADTVLVDIDSDSEIGVETVLLTEINPSGGTLEGTIQISQTNAPGVLLVGEGDMITLTYMDQDNGQGVPVVVTADALVDCTAPLISGVQVTNVEAREATIEFVADEPARGVVYYGTNCAMLNQSAMGSGYSTAPLVDLTGLQDDTTYYFAVEAFDEAGNSTYDDNGGTCYTFTTPQVPDYFTEEFDGSFDLQNKSITFTPNGSNDFYFGCVEDITALPTDPIGGTSLSLGDDDNQMITPSQPVYLYGTAWNNFYVGSNGYITFGGGDTDYTEALDDHFDMPRISALFDDLRPPSGGTVSWKEMGDRVVVTFLNVPEYYSTGSNTFQFELFFDGKIRLSYLAIGSSDNIVGLSEGNGLSPDYLASDFSAMLGCMLAGDLNCDGVINAGDIDPFVLALTDPAAYAAQFPNCNYLAADCNGDGVVNAADIDPFVQLVVQP